MRTLKNQIAVQQAVTKMSNTFPDELAKSLQLLRGSCRLFKRHIGPLQF